MMEQVCEDCEFQSQPLIKAADYGHEECVLSLMKSGADVNEKDSFHYTALINAARRGLDKSVEELIKAGANVNAREYESHTALMFAATSGHLNCLNMLIDAGANLDDSADFNKTALMFAAWNGQLQCVDTLIKAGADVNIVSSYGHTGLIGKWRSTEESHYGCIESLIAAGADVNKPDYKGRNSGYVALLEAGSEADARKIRLCLKAGVYINDAEGFRCPVLEDLIKAEIWEHEEEGDVKEVILLLLAAGEKMDGSAANIPEYIKPTISLKDICRRAIRNRLIELDPKNHLFDRIPHLKLPNSLTRYLLYNMSLDEKKDHTDAGIGEGAQSVATDHKDGK